MGTHPRTAAESEAKVALTRNKLVLEQAKAVGLLGTAKNTSLVGASALGVGSRQQRSAPMSPQTLSCWNWRFHGWLLEDDFGARLVGCKGRIPTDIDLGI